MKSALNDKRCEIFCELDESLDPTELNQLLDQLDHYTVEPPSQQATDALIAQLKPLIPRTTATTWQLLRPQWMLISKGFIVGTIVSLFIGLFLTNALDYNILRFLANASPLLGILTIFYTFRAQYSGMAEMELACPYSPAQIAATKFMIVLGYDIFLCMLATGVAGYLQVGVVLWQVVISWLAPLLLVLGAALVTSLRFGITSGCCVSALIWALQLKTGKDTSLLVMLFPNHSLLFFDSISYSYKRWETI